MTWQKTRLEKNILGEMEFVTYLHSLLTSIQDHLSRLQNDSQNYGFVHYNFELSCLITSRCRRWFSFHEAEYGTAQHHKAA